MNTSPQPSPKPKHAWISLQRVDPPKRPADRCISDFQQVDLPYDEETASQQASRCIQCPDPVCVSECPLGAPIVDLLRLTADRQFKEAAELLFATHSIPEIASHTCLGGRMCEAACVLAGKSDSVPVRAIARFLLDYGWKHGLAEPAIEPPRGQSVAVLGSGICGLVAADELSRHGYAITVFDTRQNPGGRMMNGLPGFRVDKALVERRIELLKQRGIRFQMGVEFGRNVKLSELRQQFDAVFLGFGRAEPQPLEIPGADFNGVHQAHLFITQAHQAKPDASRTQKGQRSGRERIHVQGRKVVVLGGGDTAMDAMRIAIREGAREALCVYRRDCSCLSADREEYGNAQEEGALFLFKAQPVAVIGNSENEVIAVRCVHTEPGEPESSGRASVVPRPGSEFDIPAEVVLVAHGFTAPKLPATDEFVLLAVDATGHVQVDASGMTNLPGVFAGGSIVRGPAPLSDVVLDSRRAAAAIERYLSAKIRTSLV